MVSSEFDDMDREAGVVSSPIAEVVLPVPSRRNLPASGSIAEYRSQLVKVYHHGAPSLVEKLRKSGSDGAQALIVALIDEVIKETDHLLGNQLVATENGDLRDASVISFKRAEVLEKAIKAVQSKQEFEKDSGVDIDSPAMMVVFRFFMGKIKEVFHYMKIPDEQSDLFFAKLGDVTDNWKKELREEFDTLRAR